MYFMAIVSSVHLSLCIILYLSKNETSVELNYVCLTLRNVTQFENNTLHWTTVFVIRKICYMFTYDMFTMGWELPETGVKNESGSWLFPKMQQVPGNSQLTICKHGIARKWLHFQNVRSSWQFQFIYRELEIVRNWYLFQILAKKQQKKPKSDSWQFLAHI